MDELVNVGMLRYYEYLKYLYGKMARFTSDDDHVIEVCGSDPPGTGDRHDRGVFSKKIFRWSQFDVCDKNPRRGNVVLDLRYSTLPACDVAVSTAILHHSLERDVPTIMRSMCENTRKFVIVSGPADKRVPLFGDHTWGLHYRTIDDAVNRLDFELELFERTGLNQPLSEILMVFRRRGYHETE